MIWLLLALSVASAAFLYACCLIIPPEPYCLTCGESCAASEPVCQRCKALDWEAAK